MRKSLLEALGGLRTMDTIPHRYDKLPGYGVRMLRDSVTGIDTTGAWSNPAMGPA